MISEKTLSASFSSFWNDLLPNEASYIRAINLSMLDRDQGQLQIAESPKRRGLVNFVAEAVWCRMLRQELSSTDIAGDKRLFEECVADSTNDFYIRFLGRNSMNEQTLDRNETNVVIEIAKRVFARFANSSQLTTSPQFNGAGIVIGCSGDLLVDGTLVEIKARGGPFSISDIRQCLVYYTLNAMSDRPRMINRIELYNPRRGELWSDSTMNVALQLAGCEPSELILEIQDYICDTVTSA